ncbi:bile acid:sodium symporter [Bacillus sp. FJAT-29790]|uniref:bile acid:sodium symporter family protein n=1 Tax=Bacillus sp. FJAT-29790 TaxID=1895002 RepID=UPI001C24F347|nr:bile acid:sodium symporter [Bacillus sp. FJAT-29790]MBU8878738.1 bile acid:sodium symporter [Bacillus sp. FJAT-29790]
MQIVAEFISKRLPILIVLMAISTYLSPVYWKVSSWVPSLLLGVVIFFAGISMNITAIKGIRTKRRELLLAVLLKWTLTVMISVGLAHIFFSSHSEIAAGIILSGTVPSATAATLYTFLAGGNASLVIAASLADIVISPIVTPFSILGLSGNHVSISFLNLLQSFIFIVVLPLGAGLAVQRGFPQFANHSKSITRFGSSLSLLLIIHTIVGNGAESIRMELGLLPLIVFVTFVQVVFPMLAAYVIAKKLSIGEQDARAILFQVGLCNTALAAILAFKFIGELAAIAPIVNMIINLSVGSLISNHFAKSDLIKAEKYSSGA